MLARVVAGSVALTWPALLAADELPGDGALNGKFDDIVTGTLLVLLLVGLLAAGLLRPLWAVLVAVAVFGIAVPVIYEAVRPTECPADVSGMDCPSNALAGVLVLPGLLVVLLGSVLPSRRAGAGNASVGRS